MNEIYSHRNGETEPPTIVDRYYWFQADNLHTDEVLQELIYVLSEESDIGPYIYFYDSFYRDITDDHHRVAIANLRGRWWGPVTPPWEEE